MKEETVNVLVNLGTNSERKRKFGQTKMDGVA